VHRPRDLRENALRFAGPRQVLAVAHGGGGRRRRGRRGVATAAAAAAAAAAAVGAVRANHRDDGRRQAACFLLEVAALRPRLGARAVVEVAAHEEFHGRTREVQDLLAIAAAATALLLLLLLLSRRRHGLRYACGCCCGCCAPLEESLRCSVAVESHALQLAVRGTLRAV
jgi:hypothetical protein